MTLKEYLRLKGYRFKWVALQIGMTYPSFWAFLNNESSISKQHAEALEKFTQSDWIAIPNNKNRRKNAWIMMSSAEKKDL